MPILTTLRANIAATLLGLLSAILLIIAIIQTIQVHGFFWIDGLEDKVETLQRDNNELRAELKSISDKRNEQKAETGRNIGKAETIRDEAERVAKEIEAAPTPEGCATAPEVMRADI